MAYIGQGIKQGTFKVLDTSGNTYNGSNTTFNLGTQVGSAAQLLVSHDGVIQKAGTDYTLATGGTQITFSTAPASGASIFIVEISGAVGGTVTPSDTSVTADKLNSALLTGHTDIGANIADADLFLTDDGAGGTLRKTAASRLKTYVGAGAGAFDIGNLDIDGGTDIGADIADSDLFIIDDGAGGTNRKTAASRIKSYVGGGGLVPTAQVDSGGNVGAVTLDNAFTTTYKNYIVIVDKLVPANSGASVYMQFRDESGGLGGSNYGFSNRALQANDGSEDNSDGNSQTQVTFAGGGIQNNSSKLGMRMVMHVQEPYDSSVYTGFHGTYGFINNSGIATHGYLGGVYLDNDSLRGLQLYLNTGGNLNARIKVYGVVNS